MDIEIHTKPSCSFCRYHRDFLEVNLPFFFVRVWAGCYVETSPINLNQATHSQNVLGKCLSTTRKALPSAFLRAPGKRKKKKSQESPLVCCFRHLNDSDQLQTPARPTWMGWFDVQATPSSLRQIQARVASALGSLDALGLCPCGNVISLSAQAGVHLGESIGSL